MRGRMYRRRKDTMNREDVAKELETRWAFRAVLGLRYRYWVVERYQASDPDGTAEEVLRVPTRRLAEKIAEQLTVTYEDGITRGRAEVHQDLISKTSHFGTENQLVNWLVDDYAGDEYWRGHSDGAHAEIEAARNS